MLPSISSSSSLMACQAAQHLTSAMHRHKAAMLHALTTIRTPCLTQISLRLQALKCQANARPTLHAAASSPPGSITDTAHRSEPCRRVDGAGHPQCA